MAAPVFVRKPEDAARLTFDERCYGNLAVYLSKPAVRKMGRTGLVVKGCDLRAVNVLIREHVVTRDDVYLIGVRCAGVGEPALDKCAACDAHEPQGCDVVVGEPVDATPDAEKRYAAMREIEKMEPEERWAFWKEQLGQVHPLLRLPAGLPALLLQALHRREVAAAVGGDQRPPAGQPELERGPRAAPDRPLRRLRRVRTRLPDGHPAERHQPEDGQPGRRVVRLPLRPLA